tara:strand:- start:110 stop:661 length:552 start_codon:yes stop_codon:yes gene_type:complete
VDNAVKILADFIVDDKTAVIVFLKEEGYADLPLDAPFMEVNEAVSKHILDENFVKKLSNVIFPFRGVIPASAQVAAESTQAGSSANPATWVVKVVEIGANLFIQAKSEENERLATYAQYDLAQRQLRDQTEIAKIKAQEDFAFELVKAQQERAQDNTSQNLILLLGVVGFLAIAFYAVSRSKK